jgi:nitrite reductase/ring-hydroxylating ferredoxin subunit
MGLVMRQIFAALEDELGDRQIKRVIGEDHQPLALYRLGSEFFATDDTCTHGDASLAEGELVDDGEVECPYHGGTFCIRSGEPMRAPCILPIRTHRVLVKEKKLYIELSEDVPK